VLQRLESPYTAQGIPDLVYHIGHTTGFIELKYVKAWPKRSGTTVKVGLREAQVVWLHRWKRAGAMCFVLVGIGRDILLIDGQFNQLNGYTKDELLDLAVATGVPDILVALER